MQRLWHRTQREQLDYHLRDGRAPNFDEGQPVRTELARFLIDKILRRYPPVVTPRIVELGCGAADISGPFSTDMLVDGYDIVPAAREVCAARWPSLRFTLGPVEEALPYPCDILVMTEFLEHLHDPWSVVRQWMPHAKFAIIGHPLNEPSPPHERGHLWTYELADWYTWFGEFGWEVEEVYRFPMGPYPEMVLGWGKRP